MYFKTKIRCPRHYVLIPGKDPYIREVDPMLKNVSKDAEISFGVKRTRIKRDKFGTPQVNWKSFYQPLISASYAIEHVWDPLNPICKQCRGRCMEGKGQVNEMSIKRLHG